MKLLRLIFVLTLYSAFCQDALADNDLVVVVHHENSTTLMTRSEVIDLFMGRYVAFPNGEKAVAVDLKQEHHAKRDFYKKLLGRSLSSVNAYWSRLQFSGRAKPPIKYETLENVVQYVAVTSNAIGYIPRSMVTDNLKVVYQLNE